MRTLFSLVLGLMLSSYSFGIILHGDVTGGSALGQGGTFQELNYPFNPPNGPMNRVGRNNFQTPDLYAFNEVQNLVLSNDLRANTVVGGGDRLSAGTMISSHYVLFDPRRSTTQIGYVDFDAPILALITSTSLLAASDYLYNTHVSYQNPRNRGLERRRDRVGIDALNSHRVNVDWRASSPGDFIRVITGFSAGACAAGSASQGSCPVPEPGSLALFGLGMAMLGLRRKKA